MERKVNIYFDHCPNKRTMVASVFLSSINEPLFIAMGWCRGHFFELPRWCLLFSACRQLMTQIILQYVGEMIYRNSLQRFRPLLHHILFLFQCIHCSNVIYKSILDCWFDTRQFGRDFWFQSKQWHLFPSLTEWLILNTIWTKTATIVTWHWSHPNHEILPQKDFHVLTKTRKDLKPAETTQKLPETTWKQPYYSNSFRQVWSQKLKYSKLTEIWYRRTLLYPYFEFNVYSFQNFCHSYFFWQIWSQNQKFSTLTEIWYRGTLLYACYNFNVYFFQIFASHIC